MFSFKFFDKIRRELVANSIHNFPKSSSDSGRGVGFHVEAYIKFAAILVRITLNGSRFNVGRSSDYQPCVGRQFTVQSVISGVDLSVVIVTISTDRSDRSSVGCCGHV